MKFFALAFLVILITGIIIPGCGGSSDEDTPQETSSYPWATNTNNQPAKTTRPTSSPSKTAAPTPTSSPSPSKSQTSPTPTSSIPTTPEGPEVCRFYGTITIGGIPAPAGTNVKATVGSSAIEINTNDASYRIDVVGNHPGQTVTLKVNGITAATHNWIMGEHINLDLEIP